MDSDSGTFSRIIENDRSHSASKEWRGKFIDYLEKVKAEPDTPQLSHARLYDVIMKEGAADLSGSGSLDTFTLPMSRIAPAPPARLWS